ncbi:MULTISPECIES: helix-turn-helix domain-containing protein [unclassified Mesorhizobium]|uniref:helix-turn-helix domain-containing protein n=1 Tax=unclassified Mesorhizobium TaxID=325217 RepID=UPI001CCADE94|nr:MULTISPECIES: helix-turn-helix domain-containing protein [unclassified Mesorhizobium]MBZ9742333.1 helix-turn-helix domain-containing protein [Mesorhizobium sp. CO1-1-4]MBZ9802437.1 helix-turn-helix domain-containing protein [Mesorhizobium sp. ES1-6]
MRKPDSTLDMATARRVEWPFPPGEECFAAWKNALSLLVDCSIPESADPALFDFHGCSWQLPGAFLHANGGSAMAMSRTQQVIDDRPTQHMVLYMVLEGQVTSSYDGLIQEHVPGDIVVVDYSSPYESRTSGYEGVALTLDKASVPAGLQNNVHGLVLTASEDAGAMLGTQIMALVKHIDGLSIHQSQVTVDGILRFAAAAFGAPTTRHRRDKRFLFQRASSTARQKLSDPDFGPSELAAVLGVSRSNLFRLFEPHGGVQRWMLAERLRVCLQSILRSTSDHKIAAIARNHGFRSESHFSRAFQKRYQISPSSVRALNHDSTRMAAYETLLKQGNGNGGAIVEGWLASLRA